MKKIILFGMIICLIASCSTRPQSIQDQKLVNKYRQVVGCGNYSKLKPASKDHPEVKEKCAEHYRTIDPSKEYVSASIFKGLNADILFVHLMYKSEKKQRDAVNYIYSLKRDAIIGQYHCY